MKTITVISHFSIGYHIVREILYKTDYIVHWCLLSKDVLHSSHTDTQLKYIRELTGYFPKRIITRKRETLTEDAVDGVDTVIYTADFYSISTTTTTNDDEKDTATYQLPLEYFLPYLKGRKIIYLSRTMYDDHFGNFKEEMDETKLINDHEVELYDNEDIVKLLNLSHPEYTKLGTIVIRCQEVYGDEMVDSPVTDIVNAYRTGNTISINGDIAINIIHIASLCNFIIDIVINNKMILKAKSIHICDPRDVTSMLSIARTLHKHKRNFDINYNYLSKDSRRYKLDMALALDIGFKPLNLLSKFLEVEMK